MFASNGKDEPGATEDSVAFCALGVATLCRTSQHWVGLGHLGSNWVETGGRGGVLAERTG